MQVHCINTIHSISPVTLAVTEQRPALRQLRRQCRAIGFLNTCDLIVSTIMGQLRTKRLAIEYNQEMGDTWRSISSAIPVIRVSDINDDDTYSTLSDERPDLLLTFGTSLINQRLINTAALAFNIHIGLSPYYRGNRCTEWSLLNWDPYNIGVTIHRLGVTADSGEIVGQRRVDIQSTDTVESIERRLCLAGIELVGSIVKCLRNNEKLRFSPQDLSRGVAIRTRFWSRHLRREIRRIERKQLIAVMLKHPARKERLPIVEWRQ